MRVPALAFLWNGGTISLNPRILPCPLYARVGWTIAHDEKTPGLPGNSSLPVTLEAAEGPPRICNGKRRYRHLFMGSLAGSGRQRFRTNVRSP